MEFELVSFGGTLAIGVLAVVVGWWSLHGVGICSASPLHVITKGHQGVMVLVTIAAIAAGICIDSVADDIADKDSRLSLLAPFVDEDATRVAVMFGTKPEEVPIVWRPKSLASEIVARRLFSRCATGDLHRRIARSVEDSVRRDEPIVQGGKDDKGDPLVGPTKEGEKNSVSMASLVKAVYHQAKPVVLRTSEYADELARIQQRIGFMSGLMVVGSFGAAIAAILAVVGVRQRPRASPRSGRTRIPSLVVLLGSVACHGVGAYCFTEQEGEYDKRVFGYYLSLTDVDAPPKVELRGLSGLSSLGGRNWLAALDAKKTAEEPRLAVVAITENSTEVHRCDLDLGSCSPPPADLECLTSLTASTHLACESTDYVDPQTKQRRPHRLFEFAVRSEFGVWRAHVVRHVALEWPEGTTVNIEGMLHLPPAANDTRGKVLLFDRGLGAPAAVFELAWPPGATSVERPRPLARMTLEVDGVASPVGWRACADVALDGEDLVGLSAFDPADAPLGPFATRSFRLPLAVLSRGGAVTVATQPLWSGLKGEALCAADREWLIGSDDEAFGSVVRLVPGAALAR